MIKSNSTTKSNRNLNLYENNSKQFRRVQQKDYNYFKTNTSLNPTENRIELINSIT